MSKRKGLGVAPYCLPDSSLADPVTHAELQDELTRLRSAIRLVANLRAVELGPLDARRLIELLEPPYERAAAPRPQGEETKG